MISSSSLIEPLKVVVRCRPLSDRDITTGTESIVSVDPSTSEIEIKKPQISSKSPKSKIFKFDQIYDENATQEEVFEESALPVIKDVLEGYHGTLISYGPTAAGKTFTMQGSTTGENEELEGIIPRACKAIFEKIDQSDTKYLVKASFVQIYQGNVMNLLGKNRNKTLSVAEDKNGEVLIRDLKQVRVTNSERLIKAYEVGLKNRYVASTRMNAACTTSHMIFTVTVESEDIGEDDQPCIRKGVLKLVDLAPAERILKTACTGERLKEAKSVNESLSVLGQVIAALTDPKSMHIPYRSAKLTSLLRNSLGGTTKTIFFTNIPISSHYYDEIISALRLADRAKNIKNKPIRSVITDSESIQEFQSEIGEVELENQDLQLLEEQKGDSTNFDHPEPEESKSITSHDHEEPEIKLDDAINPTTSNILEPHPEVPQDIQN